MKNPRRFAYYVLPSIWKGGSALLLLPITTYKLEPEHFGIYAIIMAYIAVATGVGGLGASQVLSANLQRLEWQDEQELISSIFIFSLLVSVVLAVISWIVWPVLARVGLEPQSLGTILRSFVVVMILIAVPWTLTVSVATVLGAAKVFATISVVESTAVAGVTILGLYVWDLGVSSLFFGAFSGAAVGAILSTFFLRAYLCNRIKKSWMKEAARVAWISFFGNLAERMQTLVERYTLTSFVGLSAVGMYQLAQQFQSIVRMFFKASINSLLPSALQEARQPEPSFPKFNSTFPVFQLFVGIASISMAFIGSDLIGVLTHNKFKGVHFYASFLLIIVQIEYMARPAYFVLIVREKYTELQKILVGSLVVSIILIPLLSFYLGVLGVIFAVFAQSILYRGGLMVIARKSTKFISIDRVSVFGIFLTFLACLIELFWSFDLLTRVFLWVFFGLFLIGFYFTSLFVPRVN